MQGPIADEPRDDELRRLLDATTDGLALDSRGSLVWANASLAQLAGAPDAKDLVGQPLDDLFADAGHGTPDGAADGPLRCRLLRPGQEPRAVVVEPIVAAHRGARSRPQPPALASCTSGALRVRDVTDLHTLESEVLRSGRQLHDANREVVALRERLRVETAEREEILTVVSHELRTPITVIAGFNRLLLAGSVGPLNGASRPTSSKRARRAASGSTTSSRTCSKPRARAPAWVRSRSPKRRSGRRSTPCSNCSRRCCAREASRRAVAIARGDAARALRSAAHRAGADEPDRQRAPLRAARLDDRDRRAPARAAAGRDFVEISVADAGPGVPERDRARIFEPYVQVEAQRAGGLGLGLAICKRIVEAHGGAIYVEARAEGGSALRVPLAGSDAACSTRGA